MTELQEKQIIFSKYLAFLLEEFWNHHITLGEAWRSPETCALYAKEGKGIAHSNHDIRLAIDLNVIDSSGNLSTDKKDYQVLAASWKEFPVRYPDIITVVPSWGGDFTSLCDFYHFSFEHNGVR